MLAGIDQVAKAALGIWLYVVPCGPQADFNATGAEQLTIDRRQNLLASNLRQLSAHDFGESWKVEDRSAGSMQPVHIILSDYQQMRYPIPGDDVMGYLSAGRGIVIHRNICGNLGEYRKQPEKWITVDWEPDIDREFSADILVEVTNRPGDLADVASTIGDAESNIEQVSIDERHEDSADLLFSILVRDRVHLASVLRNIRRMPMVNKISRPCT